MDARDFGAVGDGRHDDSDALQHAINDGDGTLHLSKGTYRITRTLHLDLTRRGYGSILGDGGTAQIVMDGAGPAILISGSHEGTAVPSSVTPQTWSRERFPVVSGVEIVGSHPKADGIQLRKTMQATVSNVLIRRCRYGLHLVERNRNFLLTDSHVYDNHEYGVFFDHCNLHQTVIAASHISYNKRAGIKSLNGDVHNLHITGNDIEYNNLPGVNESPNGEPVAAEIWFEATNGKISEVTIVSNTIQATVTPGGANIRIQGEVVGDVKTSPLISITGNVIGSQTRGIELSHVQRVSITGNTIYDSDDLSLLARHVSGLSFTGNTIVWRSDDALPERDGVRLEDCENVVISAAVTQRLCAGGADAGGAFTLVRCRNCSITDSHIMDPRYRGIDLQECQYCRVQNNTIRPLHHSYDVPESIRLTGASFGNIVTGNLVSWMISDTSSNPDRNLIEHNHDMDGVI